jgi:hypothetical protein
LADTNGTFTDWKYFCGGDNAELAGELPGSATGNAQLLSAKGHVHLIPRLDYP